MKHLTSAITLFIFLTSSLGAEESKPISAPGTPAQKEEQKKEVPQSASKNKNFAIRLTVGPDFMPASIYGAPQGRRRTYYLENGINSFKGVDADFYSFGLGLEFTFLNGIFLAGGVEYSFMSDSESKRVQNVVTNWINTLLFFGVPVASSFELSHELKLSMFRFNPRVGMNFELGSAFTLRPFVGYAFGPAWYQETVSYSGLGVQDLTIKYSSQAWFHDILGGLEILIVKDWIISGAWGTRRMPFGKLSQERRNKNSATYPNVSDKGDLFGHFWEVRIGARL